MMGGIKTSAPRLRAAPRSGVSTGLAGAGLRAAEGEHRPPNTDVHREGQLQ
jgi:hypothetical protein